MKKGFVAGVVSGLLIGAIIFGGTSALANGINPFSKSKITGVFSVFKSDGTKVADAPVIDGSTYVPVRAMSDAAGIKLKVEGKTIIMDTGENTGGATKEAPSGATSHDGQIIGGNDALSPEALEWQNKIAILKRDILTNQQFIEADKELLKSYEESRAAAEKGAAEAPFLLEGIDANIEKTKARIAEYQAKIDAANAEIAELQAKIDANK